MLSRQKGEKVGRATVSLHEVERKKKKTRNQLISANILALLKNNGGLKLRRREVTGLSEKEEAERSRACESERVLCFP